MSFSQDTKEELSKLKNLANKIQVKYELIGYLISSNTSIFKKKYIRYATENEYNINRFSKLLNNSNINFEINIEGKNFIISMKVEEILEIIDMANEEIIIKKEKIQEEELKAVIRGCFLGSGSVNNPQNKYHLEISFLNKENMQYILENSKIFDISFKILDKGNKYSLYLKEGEEISKLLALIGANSAVLKFEDIRIEREMRGKINRLVNCETANLNKTLNASIEQINAIKKLQKSKKFNKLDNNLKEIANLRLENPDMPLSELGKLLKKPVGKSGVNYRLKKLIEIANEEN
ncbi:MAG: DNA-binding protein WhiA [Clostridia bacterium]|nr:DNA-binding protein WhiA [Clostridia bacterium]